MALTYAAVTAKTVPAQHNVKYRGTSKKKSTIIIVHKNGRVSDANDKDSASQVTHQALNNDLEEALLEGTRGWDHHRAALQAMVEDVTKWINTPAPEVPSWSPRNIWNDDEGYSRSTRPYTFDPFGDDSYFSFPTCSKNSLIRSSLHDLHLDFPDEQDQISESSCTLSEV